MSRSASICMRSASSAERSSAGPSDQSARRRRCFLLNKEMVSSSALFPMLLLSGEEEEGRDSSPAGEDAEEELEEALARSCGFFDVCGKRKKGWRVSRGRKICRGELNGFPRCRRQCKK